MAQGRTLFSRPLPAVALIVIALVLDQVSKIAVDHSLPFQQPVDLLPILSLYRTYNTGVAFSWFADSAGYMIVGVRLAIVAFVVWLWFTSKPNRFLVHLGYVLVVAGALGNLIDRFLYGHVVDFVLFHTASWSFAVFNLADSFITIGAIAIGFEEIFGKKDIEVIKH
jgi:signal peptidase II